MVGSQGAQDLETTHRSPPAHSGVIDQNGVPGDVAGQHESKNVFDHERSRFEDSAKRETTFSTPAKNYANVEIQDEPRTQHNVAWGLLKPHANKVRKCDNANETASALLPSHVAVSESGENAVAQARRDRRAQKNAANKENKAQLEREDLEPRSLKENIGAVKKKDSALATTCDFLTNEDFHIADPARARSKNLQNEVEQLRDAIDQQNLQIAELKKTVLAMQDSHKTDQIALQRLKKSSASRKGEKEQLEVWVNDALIGTEQQQTLLAQELFKVKKDIQSQIDDLRKPYDGKDEFSNKHQQLANQQQQLARQQHSIESQVSQLQNQVAKVQEELSTAVAKIQSSYVTRNDVQSAFEKIVGKVVAGFASCRENVDSVRSFAEYFFCRTWVSSETVLNKSQGLKLKFEQTTKVAEELKALCHNQGMLLPLGQPSFANSSKGTVVKPAAHNEFKESVIDHRASASIALNMPTVCKPIQPKFSTVHIDIVKQSGGIPPDTILSYLTAQAPEHSVFHLREQHGVPSPQAKTALYLFYSTGRWTENIDASRVLQLFHEYPHLQVFLEVPSNTPKPSAGQWPNSRVDKLEPIKHLRAALPISVIYVTSSEVYGASPRTAVREAVSLHNKDLVQSICDAASRAK